MLNNIIISFMIMQETTKLLYHRNYTLWRILPINQHSRLFFCAIYNASSAFARLHEISSCAKRPFSGIYS